MGLEGAVIYYDDLALSISFTIDFPGFNKRGAVASIGAEYIKVNNKYIVLETNRISFNIVKSEAGFLSAIGFVNHWNPYFLFNRKRLN